MFQATTELVLLDVQVLQRSTLTATALLRAEDLIVYEDGVRQEIRHFSRDTLPLSVVLLFDLTTSVRGVLRQLANSATAALSHFKSEDEVAVMVYAAQTTLVDDFTGHRDRTVDAIQRAWRMRSRGPAHFNEAMYKSAIEFRRSQNPSSRRVVIWLTDNIPNVPFRIWWHPHSEREAIRTLHEEGVAVAPILLKNIAFLPVAALIVAQEAPWRKAFPPGDAYRYAELTGGTVMPLRGKNIAERLNELIDELRSRYTVGYRPAEVKPSGTFCRLHVELAPDARLRREEWILKARQGYYRK